jgi:HlyD family type I secretion membrane fusion protein
MRNQLVLDLADCTEYRQALQARPPRVVHGTLILLVTLLGTAVAWSALTQADLVVRGPGRIRPVTNPRKVFNSARGEVLSASLGGRVVEVRAREGDRVRHGDVLVRLETDRLDNEIAKKRRVIRAGDEEMAELAHLGELLRRQHEANRAKADAELAQGVQGVGAAREQRDADIRLAQVALEAAEAEEAPLRRLADRGAAARSDLLTAVAKTREARGKLAKARLPVDESRLAVLRRALEQADHDYAVKREELGQRRRAKGAEVEAARIELANLELERAQAVIRSPIDGVVTVGDAKVGDLLEPNKTVAEVAEQAGFRFEAVVPSEEVGHLRVGMPVRIKLDAYDYQRYGTLAGTVCFVSPDSGVEEERKTAVYTVKVAVPGTEVGRGPYRGQVKLGMAGQAEIVTGRESLLALLVKRIRQTISLG